MKRIFLVHGWDYNSHMHWYPYVKKELETKGFEVKVLDMPNTQEPKIEEWVNYFRKNVGKLDSNTHFIGHSIGCQTIMRYLQNENIKAGELFFVAGWFKLDNLEDKEVEEIANPWIETPIDMNKLKKNISKAVVFLSDNDPYGFTDYNSKKFKEMGAEVIVLKNKGHFTSEDGVVELKELINKI